MTHDPVRAKLSERMEAQHRNLLALAERWVSNPTLHDICNEFAAAFAKDLAEVSALEARLAAAEGVVKRWRAASAEHANSPYKVVAAGAFTMGKCADELSAILKGEGK